MGLGEGGSLLKVLVGRAVDDETHPREVVAPIEGLLRSTLST